MKNQDLYRFGVDWINGVLPVTDVTSVFCELEKFSSKLAYNRWKLSSTGKYNYSTRYCLDGKNIIQLMYNPQISDDGTVKPFSALERTGKGCNYGIFFTISGDGIRYLASLGGDESALSKLMFYFFRNNFRCTRFDVYCDILDKNNTGVPSLDEAFYYFTEPRVNHPTLTTNLKRNPNNIRIMENQDYNGDWYKTFQLGTHATESGMYRCYNKLDETYRKHQKPEFDEIISKYGVKDYWYRMEYELHSDRAAQIFNACIETYSEKNMSFDFGGLWLTACQYVFSVVVPASMGRGLAHADNSVSWNEFLDTVMRIIHFV